jgi:hypothetical protein
MSKAKVVKWKIVKKGINNLSHLYMDGRAYICLYVYLYS